MRRSKVLFYLFLLILLSCNNRQNDIQGAWSLSSKAIDGPLPSKLKAMFLYDAPFSYEEGIYITDSLIEFPLGFSEAKSWPCRNFLSFQVKRNKIVIDRDTVDFKFSGRKLCIENQCFNRSDSGMGMKFQYVDLQVKYDRSLSMGLKIYVSGAFDLYHSALGESRKGTFSSAEMDYFEQLGRRLEAGHLNKIYNVGTSDVREYELFIVLGDKSFAVKTFGLTGELPFEIRAFIYNVLKAIEQETEAR